jgi:hypothetical protein
MAHSGQIGVIQEVNCNPSWRGAGEWSCPLPRFGSVNRDFATGLHPVPSIVNSGDLGHDRSRGPSDSKETEM